MEMYPKEVIQAFERGERDDLAFCQFCGSDDMVGVTGDQEEVWIMCNLCFDRWNRDFNPLPISSLSGVLNKGEGAGEA